MWWHPISITTKWIWQLIQDWRSGTIVEEARRASTLSDIDHRAQWHLPSRFQHITRNLHFLLWTKKLSFPKSHFMLLEKWLAVSRVLTYLIAIRVATTKTRPWIGDNKRSQSMKQKPNHKLVEQLSSETKERNWAIGCRSTAETAIPCSDRADCLFNCWLKC